jgi:C4-dicarboxylate transporter
MACGSFFSGLINRRRYHTVQDICRALRSMASSLKEVVVVVVAAEVVQDPESTETAVGNDQYHVCPNSLSSYSYFDRPQK